MTNKTKKDILIAVLLVACMLLGVAALVFAENKIGLPIFYDGDMKTINVKITEICASNGSVIASDSGEFYDYIELHNEGETFNLADFGLSCNTDNSISYTFGDIEFPAGGYLVIYLDGTEIPFRLNADGGEYIALVSWDGTVVDSAATVAVRSDQVMLRGGEEFTLSYDASPGYPNTQEGVSAFRAGSDMGEMALAVNEIFTANVSAMPDAEGDFTDIIEIKNVSPALVSTKGYFISDDINDRMRCPLPEKILAPNEIMVIFASGKDKTFENGEFHTDFKLSSGEQAVIAKGSKHSSVDIADCESNYSQWRTVTENGAEYTQMPATIGFENTESGIEEFRQSRIYADSPLVINELLLSQDGVAYGGKLRDVIELCNISDSEISTKGWFISDSEDDPYRFSIPERTLASGECMIIYAERGEDEYSAGFGLSSGESVYLTTPDFRITEAVSAVAAGSGKSRSRVTENGEAVYVNNEISLGFANTEEGVKKYREAVRPAEIEISEAVALNKKYLAGPYGTYHDFLELHNRTGNDIDLSDWYISDDPEEPLKCSLNGLTVPANGYAVVILSADGINLPSGYFRADFSLASSGETVCISKGSQVIDTMVIPSLGINTSYGRADGDNGFSVLESPTPGKANSKTATATAIEPMSNIPQGVYDEPEITVELVGEGSIYYTLDCTAPTAESTLYTAPLKLSSTTVIRCISVAEGKKTSNISDLTFIINEPDTLETVSLVTEPANLWDTYSGIYATGVNASNVFPYNGANYYNEWEREASVSFFDSEGSGFSEKCGIRIFGGLSRALAKKSFAVFFRSSYGAGELNYQLFDDDDLAVYESFVLRNTGQDWRHSGMKDAMLTSIASDLLDIDVQNCRPVVVYLNGEYWGIYFIREKLNQNYVAGHYNVEASQAQVTFANGTRNTDYQSLLSYAKNNDLSVQANYEHICTLMDVENYIDYIVTEIIIANTDNGNIRFFTYEGGKWRWIMYDVDQSFRSSNNDTVFEHLNPEGTGSDNRFSTALINSLLKNPEFKQKFIAEFSYQLENVWTPEIVNSYIDDFSSILSNDIQRDRDLYGHGSYAEWESSVKALRSFIEKREQYVVKYVKTYFDLTDEEMLSYGFDI